jgi:hypothetical protein
MNKTEKDPEDEAFEELALKQGQWHHISGWRKRQIEQDFADIDAANNLKRNHTLEEVAVELETKFTLPFGRDTVQSFAQYIRGMKR